MSLFPCVSTCRTFLSRCMNHYLILVHIAIHIYIYSAFETLSSDANRALFEREFVPAWNNRQLPKMYYEGE